LHWLTLGLAICKVLPPKCGAHGERAFRCPSYGVSVRYGKLATEVWLTVKRKRCFLRLLHVLMIHRMNFDLVNNVTIIDKISGTKSYTVEIEIIIQALIVWAIFYSSDYIEH
jgi:hypothetical protein